MINTHKTTRTLAAALITIGTLTAGSSAALTINISDDGSGNAVIELIATGQITANGGSGQGFNVVTPGDSFIVNDTSVEDDSVSPTVNLGGVTTNRVFIGDVDGDATALPGGAQSRLGFGLFSGEFATGASASDLNGTYSTSLPFSSFVQGAYSPVLGYVDFPFSMTDIGAITLNVIPEPTSVLLLGISAIGFATRRRRIN